MPLDLCPVDKTQMGGFGDPNRAGDTQRDQDEQPGAAGRSG